MQPRLLIAVSRGIQPNPIAATASQGGVFFAGVLNQQLWIDLLAFEYHNLIMHLSSTIRLADLSQNAVER